MKIGICTDHRKYALKSIIHEFQIRMNYEVADFAGIDNE